MVNPGQSVTLRGNGMMVEIRFLARTGQTWFVPSSSDFNAASGNADVCDLCLIKAVSEGVNKKEAAA